MKFLESVSSFWSKAVEFEGTASRSEYWWAQLFLFSCAVLILCFAQSEEVDTMIFLFSDVVTFVPCMALTVRRFNDVKLPIWIPIVASLMSLFFDILSVGTDELGILDFLSLIIVIFIFGVCLAPSACRASEKESK